MHLNSLKVLLISVRKNFIGKTAKTAKTAVFQFSGTANSGFLKTRFFRNSTILVTCVALCCKSHFATINIDRFQVLMKTAEDLMPKDSKRINRRLTGIVKLFKIYLGVMWVSCLFLGLTPFITHKLPIKMWFPYDAHRFAVVFYLTAVYQIFCSLLAGGVGVTINIIVVMLMNCLALLLDDLRHDLKCHEIKPSSSFKDLQEFIDQHKKLKQFARDIEASFSVLFAIQGTKSALVLCILALCLTLVSSLVAQFLLVIDFSLRRLKAPRAT